MTKILFFTSPEEDYLADSLLLGLRDLLGTAVVDFPKKDILYSDCPDPSIAQVRGNGFTYYSGILDPIEINRSHIPQRIAKGEFAKVIFSDIWRQWGFYVQWHSAIKRNSLVFVDGQDTSRVFPYHGKFIRNRAFLLSRPSSVKRVKYFKRELTSQSRFSWLLYYTPQALLDRIPLGKNLVPISFGIPDSKILENVPKKRKCFPDHIVDIEVAELLSSSANYAFESEVDYYHDLQSSKWGITTKRAGWDCLRHYEIAANGAVICFRDLDKKPVSCAPHGLSQLNSLSYSSAKDLLEKTQFISDGMYHRLAISSLRWAHEHSTSSVAKRFLDAALGSASA